MAMKYYFRNNEEGEFIRYLKRSILRKLPIPDTPSDIQIQTISTCNASCLFCPAQDIKNNLPHGRMKMDLFRKIVDECLQIGIKKIRPYLMGEPLLDKQLPEKIKYITDRKTKGYVVKINTNASLLDEEMGRRLIEARLDRLYISFHGCTKDVYEKNMGNLVFEKVLKNVENFLKIKETMKSKKPYVRITMITTKNIKHQIPDIKKFWTERGLGVNIRPFTNRVNDRIASLNLNITKWRRFSWCDRLFNQAHILYNGDMVLCCNDWWRTTILGNVKTNSIKDIWNNEIYKRIRKKFLSNEKEGLICKTCYMTYKPPWKR
jgi:radical SAM protein with 4Fe4S-binding SPASM domain